MEEKAIRFAEECYIEGIIPIQKVKRLAEKAIRFAEECYIEGIIPIQKVKRLAEFYLVEESERTIEWQEARKRIEDTLNSYTKKEEK